MSRRICRAMDDHEWVSDSPSGPCFCQACGLQLEDAEEAHLMQELDEMESPGDWNGLVDYPDDGDD